MDDKNNYISSNLSLEIRRSSACRQEPKKVGGAYLVNLNFALFLQSLETDVCNKTCPAPYYHCVIRDGNTQTCECIKSDCRNNSNPVCGSDGKIYATECLLKETACKNNTKIKIENYAYCLRNGMLIKKWFHGTCMVGLHRECSLKRIKHFAKEKIDIIIIPRVHQLKLTDWKHLNVLYAGSFINLRFETLFVFYWLTTVDQT